MKNLVTDLYKAEAQLGAKVTVDSACYFDQLTQNQIGFKSDRLHTCLLTSPLHREHATIEELDDAIHLGSRATDQDELAVHKIVWILGYHFRGGDWDKREDSRCGSVITCVINGRSLYARVVRFLKSTAEGDDCPGYASVRWFSEPTYDNCLCPRVTLDGSAVEREVGTNLVRVTQIDPSQVAIETVGDGSFCVIRDSGYDVRRL